MLYADKEVCRNRSMQERKCADIIRKFAQMEVSGTVLHCKEPFISPLPLSRYDK